MDKNFLNLKIKDKIYNLDKNLGYKDRSKEINNILFNNNKEILNYLEDNYHKQIVRNILDIMGQYLYFGSVKDGRERDVKTQHQLDWNKKKEISVGDKDPEQVKEEFSEHHKQQDKKKSIKRYRQSKMHKLNTIRIPKHKRKNYKDYDKPLINTWDIYDNFKYTADDFQQKIDVNCFTKEDMNLPYIDVDKDYIAEWCILDNDNNFLFKGDEYNIYGKYKFDKVLVYMQDEEIYFLDMNINLIDSKLINKLKV